jgi:hypothetical protein
VLGNTLVLPQAGGDITLIKINQDGYSSEYLFRNSTDEYRAKIRHTTVKATDLYPAMDRHNFEVVHKTLAAGGVPEYYRKFYFVIEVEPGKSAIPLTDAVADLAIASSNAFLTSLQAWES